MINAAERHRKLGMYFWEEKNNNLKAVYLSNLNFWNLLVFAWRRGEGMVAVGEI